MKNTSYLFLEPSKHFVLIKKKMYKSFLKQLNFLKSLNSDYWIISRKDIFKEVKNKNNASAIISMIALWAYPNNSLGMAKTIMREKKKLTSLFEECKDIRDLDELKSLYSKYKLPGFGFTTFTKFLYFLGFTVNKTPCIILDLRIIKLIKIGQVSFLPKFEITAAYNSPIFYVEYIKKLKFFSDKIKCKPDNIELSIYLLGENYLS